MKKEDDLTGEFVEQMRSEAERRGMDPSRVREEDVEVDRDNSKIHFKWKDIGVSLPAPSRDAIDSWFKQNGQAIAGSVMTIAGVAVGVAAAAFLGSKGVDVD